MRNLSTSLFGCYAPYILIVFLDFLSTSFNSLNSLNSLFLLLFCFSHLFLILEPIEAFTFILSFFFHLIHFNLIQFSYAQISVSCFFDLFLIFHFISSQFGSFIPSYLTTCPLFMIRNPNLFILNSIPKSVLKT